MNGCIERNCTHNANKECDTKLHETGLTFNPIDLSSKILIEFVIKRVSFTM